MGKASNFLEGITPLIYVNKPPDEAETSSLYGFLYPSKMNWDSGKDSSSLVSAIHRISTFLDTTVLKSSNLFLIELTLI